MGTIQLKGRRLNGGGNEKTAGKWCAAVEHYSTISTKELSRLAAADSHIEATEVEYVISALVKQIRELAFQGHPIEIPEFGTLSVGVEGRVATDYDEVRCDRLIKRLKLNLRITPDLRNELQEVSLRMNV
ncbi:MAG: hypothetical protein IJ200_00990 [Prevotella sp.]|nr:hypothetical protein [Prevotella sp.]